MAYVFPVVGIVLGFLVLQEPVDARIIFGTALVIAGVGLVNGVGPRRCSGGRRHRSSRPRPRAVSVRALSGR